MKKEKISHFIDINLLGRRERILFSKDDLKNSNLYSIYKKLFLEFDEAFPYWIDFSELSKKLPSLNYRDMIGLSDSGFLEKHQTDDYRFRLTPNGFSVVNNVKNNEISMRLLRLTWILTILTFILSLPLLIQMVNHII